MISRLQGQRAENAAALSTAAATAPSEGRLEERAPCSTAASGKANSKQEGSDDVDEASDMGDLSMCRICFRGSRAGSLLSPCNCRGTIGFVHKECLEEWLSRKNTDECDICSYQFKVERTPKSIPDLLRDPSSRPLLWRILPPMLGSLKRAVQLLMILWLLAVKIVSYISSEPGWFLTGATVVLVGAVYFPILYLTERHHYRAFIQWRQNRSRVRLLLPNSASEGAALVHANDPPQCPPPPSESPTSVPAAFKTMAAFYDNTATTTRAAVAQQDSQATDHLIGSP